MSGTGSDASSGAQRERIWLWFRTSRGARSVAEKEFLKLPPAAVAALKTRMARYAHGESRRHDIDHLGDGIYEIRVRLSNNHFRVLFIMWGARHLVALTAFYKNQQAIPRQDMETAKSRRARWREAFGDAPEA